MSLTNLPLTASVGKMSIIKSSKSFLSRFDADKIKLKLSADVSPHPRTTISNTSTKQTG